MLFDTKELPECNQVVDICRPKNFLSCFHFNFFKIADRFEVHTMDLRMRGISIKLVVKSNLNISHQSINLWKIAKQSRNLVDYHKIAKQFEF